MMRKITLTAVAAAIATVPLTAGALRAQDSIASAPISGANACDRLAAIDPVALRRQLELFLGPALGRTPERWKPSDFDAIKQAAITCDSYRNPKGQTVKASAWVSSMDSAMRTVLPVALEVTKADTEMGDIRRRAPWLPECQSILDWKRDRKSWRSNANEIFGRDFLEMSVEELGWVRTMTDQCRIAADMIAKARRYAVNKQVGSLIAEDIIYAVDKAIEGVRERVEPSYPSHIVVMDGERRVPLSYLSSRSKMMVGIVNRARELKRELSAGEIAELTVWADGILSAEGASEPERAYASSVKEIMARQVFDNKEVGDAISDKASPTPSSRPASP